MRKNKTKTNRFKPALPRAEHGETEDILSIESIVAGGEGLARHPDGSVVFVPRTAPGERVEVTYTDVRRQWRRARVRRVIESSPERRDPSCSYYLSCGGCHLQHLDYQTAQLPIKTAIITEAFRRIGKIDVEIPEVEGSALGFEYRNRITLATDRPGTAFVAGYHHVDDPSRIVDIDRCPLAEKPINTVWAALRSAWDRTVAALPAGHGHRLTFRVNADGAVGLAIEGGRGPGRLDRLLDITGDLVSVWLLDRRGKIISHAGAPTLDERIGPYVIPLAGKAFVQVNREVAGRIDAYVHEQCGETSGKTIVDAYCGFGLRSLELARSGAFVTGIERDRHAIRTAKSLAVQTELQAQFTAGDVERFLKRILPADTVVLNPPRGGLASAVIRTLTSSDVDRIVYVSCNPSTLARDLHRLNPRFRLETLRAFDLFPQTAHVETVATLTK